MGTNLPRYESGKSIICCRFLWKATITTLVKQGAIKRMESLRRETTQTENRLCSRNSSQCFFFNLEKKYGVRLTWGGETSRQSENGENGENGKKYGVTLTRLRLCQKMGMSRPNPPHALEAITHSLPETPSIPPRLKNTGCARPQKSLGFARSKFCLFPPNIVSANLSISWNGFAPNIERALWYWTLKTAKLISALKYTVCLNVLKLKS